MARATDRSLNKQATADDIGEIISACWNRRTSYEPEKWSRSNRAFGQCAVTALVVQDLLGGDVLRGFVNGIEHYWNRLPNRIELDLTRGQFSQIHEIVNVCLVSRESILASTRTVHRYQDLRRRVFERVAAAQHSESSCLFIGTATAHQVKRLRTLFREKSMSRFIPRP